MIYLSQCIDTVYNTLIHHITFTSIVTWFFYYMASFFHCFQRIDMTKYKAFILHENYSLINFDWKLIALQYCGGFCQILKYIHTLTWITHQCTCAPLENDFLNSVSFSPVQSLSCVRLFATPWTAAHQASLSTTNSQSLLKLMFIESVMPSNHLIFSCPLLLLRSIFPSIRVSSSHQVAKVLEF